MSRKQQSALLLAGAAAGVAAAWLGRRHLSLVKSGDAPLVEGTSAELPLGSSADPEIDDALSRKLLPQDDTTGSSLFGDAAPESSPAEAALDDLWRPVPELAEPEQTEGYDAVMPEDLGTIWLERATQTTHEPHTPLAEPLAPPELEDALISEASLTSAQAIDELEDRAEPDEDEIAEDELDEKA